MPRNTLLKILITSIAYFLSGLLLTTTLSANPFQGNLAPDCSTATPSESVLWPADHKFNKINILGISDLDGDALVTQVQCIRQDEPLNANGDGNTEIDGAGVGSDTASVRRERMGNGNGRVYHISYLATDPQGAMCGGISQVSVPLSQKKNQSAVDDGSLYDSVLNNRDCNTLNINNPPSGYDQSLTVNEDIPLAITLTATDPDQDALTFAIKATPLHGTLEGQAPDLIYTSNENYYGDDTFTFTVNDGQVDSSLSTVNITVLPVNDAPIANAQSLEVDEDNNLAITLTGTDIEDAALNFTVSDSPTNGTLSGAAPNLVYAPNANYNGQDSFSFKANDGELDSELAIVTITILPVNDAPLAHPQSVEVNEDTDLPIILIGSDIENSVLIYTVSTLPSHGTLSGAVPNLIYTPNADFNGQDSFTFISNDGELDSAAASISINILLVNDAPLATDAAYELNEDDSVSVVVSATDVDTAQNLISFSILQMPSNGSLSGDFSNLVYTPNTNFNGSDSFTYVASDDIQESNTATVTFTVIPVNDAPLVGDQSLEMDQGQTLAVTLVGTDIDAGDVLSFSVVANPANGSLTGIAPNFTYTSNASFFGVENFTYKANDGSADSNIGTVTITVIQTVADRDNDGVPDDVDVFPDDPSESADLDGDGIGDNSDPDKDGDGVANDVDAFPLDATESADLDGDGIGDNADPDRDGDGVDDVDDFFPDDPESSTVPTVTITTPDTLITVGSSPITVTGTIDDPLARLTVNGVEITPSNGTFTADVALEEGLNSIVARGIDALNHEGLATITVSLDKTPPYVTIQSVEEGQTVYSDKIAVGGLVNDIVRGTVTETDSIVRVNGQLATVTNRYYLAEDIPLVVGENSIEVVASDAVGNVGNAFVTINYEVQTKNIVELVSGQSQSAVIATALASPLQVKLTSDGVAVVDKTVIFRVIEGDGELQAGIEEGANGAIVNTDANGVASVNFAVGSRAGVGNHRVRARAVGFDGEIVFHANATYGEGSTVGVIAGYNQRGSVRQPLPSPMVVAVTDSGANLIPNANIEWKVTQGSGTFQNGETTYLTTTDTDGRASAHLTLGPEEGLDQQRVTATLVGVGNYAGFTASGFMPGDPGQTSIKGVVLDNQDVPLPNVTVRVDGSTRQAISDATGQFIITQAPVGPVHLLVEGSTTTRAGEWPTLSYNIVTVPGVVNPLASPIYLVELDIASAMMVGREDVEFTLPDMPGFMLKVKAGSVTFPDGSKEGLLSVTSVNANKIPMPPPNGMQPQFIVTIQPHGTLFDAPAELTLPNVDGHKPGAEVEMYSYDHDLEEFVTIGLGTVSKDGATITSNPGVGVIKAGWHCGSAPGDSVCCIGPGTGLGNGESLEKFCAPECGEVKYLATALPPFECGPDSIIASCELKPDQGSIERLVQDPTDCKIDMCGDPKPDPNGMPVDITANQDCKVTGCDGVDINVTTLDDPSDIPTLDYNEDNFCRACGDDPDIAGVDFNLISINNGVALPGYECRVCENGLGVDKDPDMTVDASKYCYSCKAGMLEVNLAKEGTTLPGDECKYCKNGTADPITIDTFDALADSTPVTLIKPLSKTTAGNSAVVNFNSITDGKGCTFEYLWNFDDSLNSTSTLKKPSFTYTTPGKYTVTVEASCADCSTVKKTSSVDVIVVDIEVVLNKSILTLLDQYALSAKITPNSLNTTLYKYEIRRKTDTVWYSLKNNFNSTFADKAYVAGEFEIRVSAYVENIPVVSDPVNLTVQFPSYTDIVSDATVISDANVSWLSTLNYATADKYREEGYYIQLNTSTETYQKLATIYGDDVVIIDGKAQARAKIESFKPPDSISNPTPLDKPNYIIAFFHTHPPTFYLNESIERAVGPSGSLIDPIGDVATAIARDLVGIVYDYTPTFTSIFFGPSIKGGHPLHSSAVLYPTIGPTNRRSTP